MLDYEWTFSGGTGAFATSPTGTVTGPVASEQAIIDAMEIVFEPTSTGTFVFTLSLVDAFGCMDDTSVGDQTSFTVEVRDSDLAPCNTLPVEFISFDGQLINSRLAELKWVTATELDNDRFELERKIDNLEEWEKVGEVQGAGTSTITQYYQYDDHLPIAANLIYYRLKQIDLDGSFVYSNIVVLRNKVEKDLITVVNDPNGGIRVSVGTDGNRDIRSIQLFNTIGQRVQSIEVNENLRGGIFHQTIETNGLASGMYFLQVIFDDGTMSSKAIRF